MCLVTTDNCLHTSYTFAKSTIYMQNKKEMPIVLEIGT